MRLHRWRRTCISAVDVAEQTATRFTDAPLDLRMDLVLALSMHVSMQGQICFCRPKRKRGFGQTGQRSAAALAGVLTGALTDGPSLTCLPVRTAGLTKARQVCNRLAVVLAGLERPLNQISGSTPVRRHPRPPGPPNTPCQPTNHNRAPPKNPGLATTSVDQARGAPRATALPRARAKGHLENHSPP